MMMHYVYNNKYIQDIHIILFTSVLIKSSKSQDDPIQQQFWEMWI